MTTKKGLSAIFEEENSREIVNGLVKSSSLKVSKSEEHKEKKLSKRISIVAPLQKHEDPNGRRSTAIRASQKRFSSHRQRTASVQERLINRVIASKRPLFNTVAGDSGEVLKNTPTFLIASFGLRSVSSLQTALAIQEHEKLQELYRAESQHVTTPASTSHSSASSTQSSTSYTAPNQLGASLLEDSNSSTSATTQASDDNVYTCEKELKNIKYLMGLPECEEEISEMDRKNYGIEETIIAKEDDNKMSEAMKHAQQYLKNHKIFEFFQFIVSHLLSALPEDPIKFILDVLERCLMFRAGVEKPPLLYERKHLECLFYLMDKMHTDYIDLKQYEIGLSTVGVKPPYHRPFTTRDGMVKKIDFIEEAYASLTLMLSDMVKGEGKLKVPEGRYSTGSHMSSHMSAATSSECFFYRSIFLPKLDK